MDPLIQSGDKKNKSKQSNSVKYTKLEEEVVVMNSGKEAMKMFLEENFRYTKYRWLVLFLIAFSCFGGFYCYQIITA